MLNYISKIKTNEEKYKEYDGKERVSDALRCTSFAVNPSRKGTVDKRRAKQKGALLAESVGWSM